MTPSPPLPLFHHWPFINLILNSLQISSSHVSLSMEGSSTSHKRKKNDEHTKKSKKRQHVRANNVENKMEEKRSGSNEESLGVFEFPWMKESMISTSLDWSLPESMFPVLDDGNEMFEEISDVRWPVKRVSNYRLEFEAFECIWTSILD